MNRLSKCLNGLLAIIIFVAIQFVGRNTPCGCIWTNVKFGKFFGNGDAFDVLHGIKLIAKRHYVVKNTKNKRVLCEFYGKFIVGIVDILRFTPW